MKTGLFETIESKSYDIERPNTKVDVCNFLADTEISLGNYPLVFVDESVIEETDIAKLCRRAEEGNVITLPGGESMTLRVRPNRYL